MSKTEKAVAWAEQIAADNRHGYGWGGWGPDYDCGHLVIQAYEQAGIRLKSAGATYTGNMRAAALRCGFKDVTAGINLATGAGLRRGDILLNQASHAALCVGSGRIVQARSNFDGLPGDSSGNEIRVQGYYNYPWDCVLRPPVSETSAQPSTSAPTSAAATYTVKTGDTLWGIAKANGITLQQLIAWNNIQNPDRVYPGDVLKLSQTESPAQNGTRQEAGAAAPSDKPVSQKPEMVQNGTRAYTVKAGDTLWGIAARFLGSGTKFGQIAKENGIGVPYLIHPGQVLRIPEE